MDVAADRGRRRRDSYGPAALAVSLARVPGGLHDSEEGFPARYTALFVVVAVGLIGGGLVLWFPERGGPSTANSDLGLALFGGGLALTAGYLVSRAVFVAQARLDRELRRAEERRERDNQRVMLSMTESMPGVDLREADLQGISLRQKDLTGANLRGANLEGATMDRVYLNNACLAGANLRRAAIGVPGFSAGMTNVDLTDADLSEATIIADLRLSTLRGADLRGADLSRAMVSHPHPEQAEPETIEREAANFEGAKYDERTQWPPDFDVDAARAVRA
jgi:uncharacterized protein YjbI with pentapeptide repeats